MIILDRPNSSFHMTWKYLRQYTRPGNALIFREVSRKQLVQVFRSTPDRQGWRTGWVHGISVDSDGRYPCDWKVCLGPRLIVGCVSFTVEETRQIVRWAKWWWVGF